MLTDLGNGVARTYGLTFRFPDRLSRFNGDPSWELAVPATYVVRPDGIVAYAAADPDYTRRPEPTELLPVLDGLVRGGPPTP